jgi:hypothetical protein
MIIHSNAARVMLPRDISPPFPPVALRFDKRQPALLDFR